MRNESIENESQEDQEKGSAWVRAEQEMLRLIRIGKFKPDYELPPATKSNPFMEGWKERKEAPKAEK